MYKKKTCVSDVALEKLNGALVKFIHELVTFHMTCQVKIVQDTRKNRVNESR